jgi:hypothetical protein
MAGKKAAARAAGLTALVPLLKRERQIQSVPGLEAGLAPEGTPAVY